MSMTSSVFSATTISIPASPESARTTTSATAARDRIAALDVLRGFALLGIFVLNVDNFAGPLAYHDIPYEAFSGPHRLINLITFYIKWMFFEGKMRGLFSMLFGAGVILMTSRAQRRGNGQEMADIYLRRNLLLAALGLLHTVFIWEGDILFDYGFIALLGLYALRNLAPRTLLITGTAMLLTVGTWAICAKAGGYQDALLRNQARNIEAREKSGLPVTKEQMDVVKAWQKDLESHAVPEKIKKQTAAASQGYFNSIADSARDFVSNFGVHLMVVADSMPAMMIGMGLMRIGFLTGELSYLTYILTAAIGFGISLPLVVAGISETVASDLDFITIAEWMFTPYCLIRWAGMLAVAAVLVMIIKSGILRTVQRLLGSVGRMALSNYLLTSLICQFIFVWGPWKLYGHLEYYQHTYVVVAVGAVNLIFSTLWLRAFAFGPVEWVWRSLTYLKAQPMRLPFRAAAA
jgi:uncharacterized protein